MNTSEQNPIELARWILDPNGEPVPQDKAQEYAETLAKGILMLQETYQREAQVVIANLEGKVSAYELAISKQSIVVVNDNGQRALEPNQSLPVKIIDEEKSIVSELAARMGRLEREEEQRRKREEPVYIPDPVYLDQRAKEITAVKSGEQFSGPGIED